MNGNQTPSRNSVIVIVAAVLAVPMISVAGIIAIAITDMAKAGC